MVQTVEKKVGIPESVTINGVTYVVKDTPELLQLIQDVAKIERSKLYTQFENLKSQIANLGKVRVTDDHRGTDVDALVEKLKGTFVTKEDFKEVLPGVIKEVVQPVLTATEQNRKNELDQYREKIINENIATCIPDLVKGETKEELDNSLKESIRIRASYPTPSTAGIPSDRHVKDPLIAKQENDMTAPQPGFTPTPRAVEQANAPTPAAPVPPVAPRRPSPEADGSPVNVKGMTMSEFEKKRDALRQQLESMYGDRSLY